MDAERRAEIRKYHVAYDSLWAFCDIGACELDDHRPYCTVDHQRTPCDAIGALDAYEIAKGTILSLQVQIADMLGTPFPGKNDDS